MENFINLVGLVVWPITILIVFFVLRKPISSLIGFTRNVKYKEFEVSFDEKVKEISAEAEDSGVTTTLSSEEKEDIYRLVEVSPSAAVVEAWKEIEIAAREKVNELAGGAEMPVNAKRRPLLYIEHSGALTPSTASTIRDLQQLRNQAAHTKELHLSEDSVIEYVRLSKQVAQQIKAIIELPKQKLLILTLLILQYNLLIDTGKYDHISISDIHEQIEKRDIVGYLKRVAADDTDFSFFGEDGSYSEYLKFYNEQMYQLYGGYAGDERRKWGVENSGLCLLVAWTNELIQQGSGWYPDNRE